MPDMLMQTHPDDADTIQSLRRELAEAAEAKAALNENSGVFWAQAADKFAKERDAAIQRAEKAEAEQKKWEELALRACVVRDETTAERDAAVSRAAALEAALIAAYASLLKWSGADHFEAADEAAREALRGVRKALSGGTSALDAHDAALREEIAKRMEGLRSRRIALLGGPAALDVVVMLRDEVLAEIRKRG